MTNPKNTKVSEAAADKTAKQPALSKHDKVAIENAETNTKNDGSHITKQRKALVEASKKEAK